MVHRVLPFLFFTTLGCTDGGTTPPEADTDTDADVDTDTDADTDADADADAIVPDATLYRFPSQADSSADSVSYGGQVFRQLLIHDLTTYIEGLTTRIDDGLYFPADGEVAADLEFWFAFDSATSGEVAHLFETSPATTQVAYDDVSSDKDLVAKLAGNDPVGQHTDWSTGLVGWNDPTVTTPESLVRLWFAQVDALAVQRSNGTLLFDPAGFPIPEVYVTADGVDFKQLLEKFLGGAVSYSQGTDDYLDDDEPGKGLLSDHSTLEDGKPYTALEHAWDEGFGYFGAARDYPQLSDDQIADEGVFDTDGDGGIDLLAEVCFGHSVNAAKRDAGSIDDGIDYTSDAWQGFHAGRTLLSSTAGTLSPTELSTLQGHRDQAVEAWENAIAATVVHYLNDVLQDMASMDGPTYDFSAHAKHWSELKGFSLALQFNPRSRLADADFATLHDLIGQAPVLESEDLPTREAHSQALRHARQLFGTTYGFSAANLGDADGENGW